MSAGSPPQAPKPAVLRAPFHGRSWQPAGRCQAAGQEWVEGSKIARCPAPAEEARCTSRSCCSHSSPRSLALSSSRHPPSRRRLRLARRVSSTARRRGRSAMRAASRRRKARPSFAVACWPPTPASRYAARASRSTRSATCQWDSGALRPTSRAGSSSPGYPLAATTSTPRSGRSSDSSTGNGARENRENRSI